MKRIVTSRWLWILACAPCLGLVACGSSSQNNEGDSGTESEGGSDATFEGAPGPEGSTGDGTVTDSRAMDTGPDTTSSSGGDTGAVDAPTDATDATTEATTDASEAGDGSTASDSAMHDAADGGANALPDALPDAIVDAPTDSADAGLPGDSSADGSDGGTNPCSTCATGLCGTNLTAFTGTQTSGWNLNGAAHYDTTANTVLLCDGTNTAQAGTLFYKDLITADAFTFAFDFRLTTTNGRADGIGFVMQTTGATAVGAAYGGLGFMNLSGYAVELDIFDSGPCDPGNGNHAGVDLLSQCSSNMGIPSPIATSPDLFGLGVGDIGDGSWRTATIQLASGQLSVVITSSTGTPVTVGNLQNVALPSFVSGTQYYLGLTGGTGSNTLYAREEIRNVNLTFGTTHCL